MSCKIPKQLNMGQQEFYHRAWSRNRERNWWQLTDQSQQWSGSLIIPLNLGMNSGSLASVSHSTN